VVEDEIRARYGGDEVADTEGLPGYLLSESGLDDATPAGYARSVQDGTSPSASARAAMSALLSHHRVRALVYNAQTSDAATARAQEEAAAAGVPVVVMYETMPPQFTTIGRWMYVNAEALFVALRRG
jgi:zinc/manganese transport system substrate-binding protein